MNIGQKLLDLRKSKHLSQEEVADKLNVTRQTVSKWETDQSTPDFDKINPICELYNVSADELLSTNKINKIENVTDTRKMKANGIGKGIMIYFIAVAWIMTAIPVFKINPIVSSAIFLIICGIATYIIIYTNIVYKKTKTKEEKKESNFLKQINSIVSTITLIIYLLISFITNAWHITWLLWIVDGLIQQIIKLIYMLRSNENEK